MPDSAPAPLPATLFAEILERTQVRLVGFARGLLGNSEDARDLVQDVDGAYSLQANYKRSVQVTLQGATAVKLEMDDDSRSLGHVITCSPQHCDLDSHADTACTCDTAGPLTLAISVNGPSERFFVGSTVLGSVTEPSALHPDSVGLGVTASTPSAQGAQAIFANFAVVAA